MRIVVQFYVIPPPIIGVPFVKFYTLHTLYFSMLRTAANWINEFPLLQDLL